jgi:hypothetical protein
MLLFEAKKEENLLDFLTARLKGATKIAREAKAKGGLSNLTAWHFEAKLPEYRKIINMVKSGKAEKAIKEYCRQEFRALAKKMVSPHISQEAFQRLAGQAEVFGEVDNKIP